MSKTKTSISPPTISKSIPPIFIIVIKCNIIFRVTTLRKLAFNLLNTLLPNFHIVNQDFLQITSLSVL